MFLVNVFSGYEIVNIFRYEMVNNFKGYEMVNIFSGYEKGALAGNGLIIQCFSYYAKFYYVYRCTPHNLVLGRGATQNYRKNYHLFPFVNTTLQIKNLFYIPPTPFN